MSLFLPLLFPIIAWSEETLIEDGYTTSDQQQYNEAVIGIKQRTLTSWRTEKKKEENWLTRTGAFKKVSLPQLKK